MTVKVKICGITNREDALMLAENKADMLGFLVLDKDIEQRLRSSLSVYGASQSSHGKNFKTISKSLNKHQQMKETINIPNNISKEKAKEIISGLPSNCFTILATISTDPDEIAELCEYVKPTAVQLHSDISKENIEILRSRIRQKIIRVIFVANESAIEEAKKFEEVCDFIMLDHRPGEKGPLNPEICRRIVEACSRPVILEGGLKIENAREIVFKVRPYGVGVMSGVESVPGKKDAEKVREFVKEVRRA